MAETWMSIEVELVSGRGEDYWPRPGRIFAVAPTDTFWNLAEAINVAFGRWDHSHLSEFILADGTRISLADPEFDDLGDTVDIQTEPLGRLALSEQFAFIYDFGDGWTHLCTVWSEPIDPEVELGMVPDRPVPLSGWGILPDQYGRRWADDDGESPLPPDPAGTDLPQILPEWS